jgi:hypothetical protein
MKRRNFIQTCASIALTAGLGHDEPQTTGKTVGPK